MPIHTPNAATRRRRIRVRELRLRVGGADPPAGGSTVQRTVRRGDRAADLRRKAPQQHQREDERHDRHGHPKCAIATRSPFRQPSTANATNGITGVSRTTLCSNVPVRSAANPKAVRTAPTPIAVAGPAAQPSTPPTMDNASSNPPRANVSRATKRTIAPPAARPENGPVRHHHAAAKRPGDRLDRVETRSVAIGNCDGDAGRRRRGTDQLIAARLLLERFPADTGSVERPQGLDPSSVSSADNGSVSAGPVVPSSSFSRVAYWVRKSSPLEEGFARSLRSAATAAAMVGSSSMATRRCTAHAAIAARFGRLAGRSGPVSE